MTGSRRLLAVVAIVAGLLVVRRLQSGGTHTGTEAE